MLSVGPAVTVVTLPTLAALIFTLNESIRGSAGVDIYRRLLVGESEGTEFWRSAIFSLVIGMFSTLLAGVISLGLVSWWHQNVIRTGGLNWNPLRAASRRRGARVSKPGEARSSLFFFFWLVLSVPHLAWASALLLLLTQSGFVARLAFAVGFVTQPSDFPALVADPYGFGLIIHYVTKETPFIVIAAIAALSVHERDFQSVAASLGASPLQRARYVTWPAVRPAIAGAMLISFGFVLHSVEAPIILGGSQPRMMSVVAAELFSEPTVDRRADAAAMGIFLTLLAVTFGGAGSLLVRRRSVSDR